MRNRRSAVWPALALLAAPLIARAQVIDLTIHDHGLAIGDKPVVYGLRLNYRDEKLEKVNARISRSGRRTIPRRGR